MLGEGSLAYNEADVRTAIEQIQSCYENMIISLTDVNVNEFVQPFSSIWASEQAVDFFGKYKNAIEELATGIDKTFQSIIDALNTAASAFAEQSDTSWRVIAFTKKMATLDVSSIKTNIDGNRGIDINEVPTVLAKLDTIKARLSGSLHVTKSSIEKSGFIGGGMQTALNASINTISEKIENTFSEVKTLVNEAIQGTVDSYKALSNKVSTSFSGGQTSVTHEKM